MTNVNEIFEYPDEYNFVLESMDTVDVLVADNKGCIIEAQDNCEYIYGCKSDNIVGRSVFELEQEGLFNPSSIAKVLETGKEIKLIQKVNNDKYFMVTAIPIKDENNEILRIVTYSTDIEGYISLKRWSDELNNKINNYNEKISELEHKQKEVERILGGKPALGSINTRSNSLDKEDIMQDVVTNSQIFKEVLEQIKKMAKYDVNILLLGETGAGKTMLAKKIHMISDYSEGEFVEVNCGAIPPHLIESELFGYTKGSFTGANSDGKKGLLEIAHKGTIFLDEISELPIQAQVKLLKVLQDKTVRRIGGTTSRKVDFRIVAATNKDLYKESKNGNFRMDLFYRLNTITLKLPALRERHEDIYMLSNYLVKKYNKKYNLNKILSVEVIEELKKYSWPGNIREMENIIQGLILSTDGDLILPDRLPKHIFHSQKTSPKLAYNTEDEDLNKMLDDFEGEVIKKYFDKYKSSIKVAKALNISQTTAARKIRKYINE